MDTQRDLARWTWPRPFPPRLSARLNYVVHRFLVPNRFNRMLGRVVERFPRLRQGFTSGEKVVKEASFGCRMCGQCALPFTGYACPQTCPKQLRNGPCGGVSRNGDCEVYPGMRCVWLVAYERSEAAGHLEDLMLLGRPLDHRLGGTSSWLNYWQGRDEGLYGVVDVELAPWPARSAS